MSEASVSAPSDVYGGGLGLVRSMYVAGDLCRDTKVLALSRLLLLRPRAACFL